jgi:hypothetical protein
MTVIYRFDLVGRDGSTMGGHMDGAPYTAAQALAWALDDLRSGRARPIAIIADGQVVYDLATLEHLAARPDPIEYD